MLESQDGATSTLPIAEPEQVGMSAPRLALIAPLIHRYVEAGLISGAVTMVARRGRIVHFEASGLRDREAGVPMTRDTIFRIASMTKPVTSVALMMLYEQARIGLEDPVAEFLPAFEKMDVAVEGEDGQIVRVPARRAIRVRHLLTHTAGLPTEQQRKSRKALREAARIQGPDEVIADFVDRLARLPLDSEPGAVWDYSRATCVVGRLVEVVSGLSLADFLRQRIFEPLGMQDTHFFLPEDKLDRFAAAYEPGAGGRIELLDPPSVESFFVSGPRGYFMGSGGLVSTASDYFRFADMLMRGGRRGGERILSRKTVELMTRNHVGDKWVWLAGPGQGFGLGFGVTLDRGRAHAMPTEGSYTWGGAFNTHWWNDPAERLFGMVLTQVRPYHHLDLRQDFQTLVTSAIDD